MSTSLRLTTASTLSLSCYKTCSHADSLDFLSCYFDFHYCFGYPLTTAAGAALTAGAGAFTAATATLSLLRCYFTTAAAGFTAAARTLVDNSSTNAAAVF